VLNIDNKMTIMFKFGKKIDKMVKTDAVLEPLSL